MTCRRSFPLARSSSAHLASLDARLSTILSTLQSRDTSSSPPGGLDVNDALLHIQQLSDQVLLEVQSVAHKLDQSSTQSSASSGVLQAKTGELVNLARQAEERALALATKGDWSKWLWMVGGVGAGWALTRWKDSRKRDDVWDERKFL